VKTHKSGQGGLLPGRGLPFERRLILEGTTKTINGNHIQKNGCSRI